MNSEGSEILGPRRTLKRYLRERHCDGGHLCQFLTFALHFLAALRKTESIAGKKKDRDGHGYPKQPVPQQIAAVSRSDGIFLCYCPVPGDIGIRANAKWIENSSQLLSLDVLQENVGNDVSRKHDQRSNKRDDFIARKNRDGKENLGNDEGVRQSKNENPIQMGLPNHWPPAVRLNPGHIFRENDSDGNAQHGNHGHKRGAEKSPQKKIGFAQRRREDNLVRVEAEIARGGGIHEGRSHDHCKQANERVKVLNVVRRVAKGIG